jgi:putative heme iron utilization protein
MLRAHRYGALCTISKKFDGYPFGSITPYLVDHDGSLLILVSALAEHTKNIWHDSRVSLITHDQRSPDIQTQGRVTILGEAGLEQNREQAGLRYLRYFPEAKTYLAMHDFSFFRINPLAIRYIGGFGKIHWVDMENYAVAQAGSFKQGEDASLAEINARQNDVLKQLLQQRHNTDVADIEAIGLDCDGLDVRIDGQIWRLDFPEAVSAPLLDGLAPFEKGG